MPLTRSAALGAARWLAVAVPVVDLGLVLSGLLSPRTGLVVGLVLELLLAVVVVVEIRLFRAAYRQGRAQGLARRRSVVLGLEAAWPPIVLRAARAEIGLMRALWWGIRGRRSVEPGAVELGYADRLTVMMWAICGVGLIELGVVHVLTARWPVLRWSSFALGGYAIVWVLGFGLSLRQHAHLLRDGELVLRFGHFRSTTVPLAGPAAVRTSAVSTHRRNLLLEDGALVVSVMADTNVELRIDPPVEVDAGKGPAQVTRLSFYADDPRAAVRVLRERGVTAGR